MPRQVKKADLPTKVCQSCNREMVWRKSWAKNWEQVKYCSDRCRKNRQRDTDSGL